MSEESNVERLRNFLRQKKEEVYYEQDEGVQRRISRFGNRLRVLNKRYNPVKLEKVPGGREIMRRHLIGGATGVAEILDGKHTVKRSFPRQPLKRKKRARKSRVVK